MMDLQHYRFKLHLRWMALKYGKTVDRDEHGARNIFIRALTKCGVYTASAT